MKKKTTEADIEKLREKLCEIGDSVICIGDLNLVKVHVHSNTPNKALEYALELGELYNLKIENMREQNRELKKKAVVEETKENGMVAVAAGEGISAIYKDLGVDEVIVGGQTMNPSAADIASAADKVPPPRKPGSPPSKCPSTSTASGGSLPSHEKPSPRNLSKRWLSEGKRH